MFEFTQSNLTLVEKYIAQYPRKRSAILWCLHIAQDQNAGYLSDDAIKAVASALEMCPAQVKEVAGFYKMFKFKPVGKYLIQVCTSVSCWLKGSGSILGDFMKMGMVNKLGQITEDNNFTVEEICCIGACSNAPAALINNMPYEDLTAKGVEDIMNQLRKGQVPRSGSQTGRICSSKQSQEIADVKGKR